MKRLFLVGIVLSLSACGRAIPADSVDSLVSRPDRLKTVIRQCRDDRARSRDVECVHASEAFRRRFMGDGKGKYTPGPVSPY